MSKFKRASLSDTDSLLTNHCALYPIVDKQGKKKGGGDKASFPWGIEMVHGMKRHLAAQVANPGLSQVRKQKQCCEPPNCRGGDTLGADGVMASIKAAVCEGCVKLPAASLRKER